MSKKKGKITDVQALGICHFVALVLLSFFGAFVFELVEMFSGSTVSYILLPINRSMWEFGKMLFIAMSVVFVVEYFVVGRKIKSFIPMHLLITFIVPLALMTVLATFNFFFGSLSMQGAQAVLFLTLIIGAFLLSIVWVSSKKDFSKRTTVFFIMYIALLGLFVLFSFVRPELKLFFDYGGNTYRALY